MDFVAHFAGPVTLCKRRTEQGLENIEHLAISVRLSFQKADRELTKYSPSNPTA